MSQWMWLYFFSFLSVILAADDFPTVKTPLGSIKGYYKLSQNGKRYRAFEGIPYAKPPVGDLRFKEPQRTSTWVGELAATKLSDACVQFAHEPLNAGVLGSEDCLYLNIYVPDRKTDSDLFPVILWIHGGAFQYGTGSIYGPHFLMDEDLILVTINYRLGPLGFLSTEDDIVPGNMGLKDQSMAMKWVSENIESFQGDRKKVTIAGGSAGGASVHYHYLSPLSAGLFHNGISVSGTAYDCWTQTENALEKAKKLGTIMGCPHNDTSMMVDCLRHRPVRPLVQAVKEFMPWLFNPYTPFGPVVEKGGDHPFIDRSPRDIINFGDVLDVPWITSVTSEEGLYPVAEFITSDHLLKELNDNWNAIAPHLLDFNFTIPEKEHASIAQKIKKHYFGNKPIERSNVHSLTKMVGDRLFVVDAEKAAREQAAVNKSPVWFYYYSYRAVHSLSDYFAKNTENFGVSHADDVLLLFQTPLTGDPTTIEDLSMQKDLMKLWVSFSTKNMPDMSTEWPPVDPSAKDLSYLHIMGPKDFEVQKNSDLGQKKFWNTLHFSENNFKIRSDKNEL